METNLWSLWGGKSQEVLGTFLEDWSMMSFSLQQEVTSLLVQFISYIFSLTILSLPHVITFNSRLAANVIGFIFWDQVPNKLL